jgi:hypothetical protein
VSEMVERLAKALFAIRMATVAGDSRFEQYAWDRENNSYREHCLREARACIEALREPTPEMVEAAAGGIADFSERYIGSARSAVETAWTAMLDAALTSDASDKG